MGFRKALVAAIFAAFAGISLLSGYSAQRSKSPPPRATAYSYSTGNKGTVQGRVGTEKSGLEYKVQDLSSPKADVAAKLGTVKARAEVDFSTSKAAVYAEAKLNGAATVRARSYFEDNNQVQSAVYEQVFNSWLEHAAFQYTESLGQHRRSSLSAYLRFGILGRKLAWTPYYDLEKKTLDLGRILFV